jgi:hypothetical protein
MQDDPRSVQPETQRTDENVDRVRINGESTRLYGSVDKVTGICSEKPPELWPHKWVLHHGNVPAHAALTVRELLAKKFTTKVDHPPYSPDLCP